ncbi:hypothetical protein JCM1841_001396 [Sporobolomyces salmonicolor]
MTVTGYDVVTVFGVAAFSTSTPSSATATPPGAATITPAPSSTIFASSAKTVKPGTSSPALNDAGSPSVAAFSDPSSASSASGQDFTSALAFPSSFQLNPESPVFPSQHAARNFIGDRHFSPPFLDIADSFFNDLPNIIDLELIQLWDLKWACISGCRPVTGVFFVTSGSLLLQLLQFFRLLQLVLHTAGRSLLITHNPGHSLLIIHTV